MSPLAAGDGCAFASLSEFHNSSSFLDGRLAYEVWRTARVRKTHETNLDLMIRRASRWSRVMRTVFEVATLSLAPDDARFGVDGGVAEVETNDPGTRWFGTRKFLIGVVYLLAWCESVLQPSLARSELRELHGE